MCDIHSDSTYQKCNEENYILCGVNSKNKVECKECENFNNTLQYLIKLEDVGFYNCNLKKYIKLNFNDQSVHIPSPHNSVFSDHSNNIIPILIYCATISNKNLYKQNIHLLSIPYEKDYNSNNNGIDFNEINFRGYYGATLINLIYKYCECHNLEFQIKLESKQYNRYFTYSIKCYKEKNDFDEFLMINYYYDSDSKPYYNSINLDFITRQNTKKFLGYYPLDVFVINLLRETFEN